MFNKSLFYYFTLSYFKNRLFRSLISMIRLRLDAIIRQTIFNNRKVANLCPIVTIKRAVTDRLADVGRLYIRARFQIGDRPRDLQDPVVRAS